MPKNIAFPMRSFDPSPSKPPDSVYHESLIKPFVQKYAPNLKYLIALSFACFSNFFGLCLLIPSVTESLRTLPLVLIGLVFNRAHCCETSPIVLRRSSAALSALSISYNPYPISTSPLSRLMTKSASAQIKAG